MIHAMLFLARCPVQRASTSVIPIVFTLRGKDAEPVRRNTMDSLDLTILKLDEIHATLHRIYKFLDTVPPCQQEYDPNATAESQHGEPK